MVDYLHVLGGIDDSFLIIAHTLELPARHFFNTDAFREEA